MGAGSFKFDSNARQCQGVAQRDQIAGLFGGHDACDAGDAQHVAFLGCARFDQCQGFGLHFDVACGYGHTVGGGFGAYVHHVGLALCVEVGEGAGGVIWCVGHGEIRCGLARFDASRAKQSAGQGIIRLRAPGWRCGAGHSGREMIRA